MYSLQWVSLRCYSWRSGVGVYVTATCPGPRSRQTPGCSLLLVAGRNNLHYRHICRFSSMLIIYYKPLIAFVNFGYLGSWSYIKIFDGGLEFFVTVFVGWIVTAIGGPYGQIACLCLTMFAACLLFIAVVSYVTYQLVFCPSLCLSACVGSQFECCISSSFWNYLCTWLIYM